MPISDILSCPESELAACIEGTEYELGAWYQAKNIGTIELSKLGEIIGTESYNEVKSGFGLVGEPLPEGPWPETFPESLSASILALSPNDIPSVCEKWAAIEEFGGFVSPDDLASYLRGLGDFMRSHNGPYFLVNAL